MTVFTRFTVSVPAKLLEEVDERLVTPATSRSAVVRRLLEAALRQVQEQEDVRRYIEGYQKTPQTEDELGWTDQAVRDSLADMPWQ